MKFPLISTPYFFPVFKNIFTVILFTGKKEIQVWECLPPVSWDPASVQAYHWQSCAVQAGKCGCLFFYSEIWKTPLYFFCVGNQNISEGNPWSFQKKRGLKENSTFFFCLIWDFCNNYHTVYLKNHTSSLAFCLHCYLFEHIIK